MGRPKGSPTKPLTAAVIAQVVLRMRAGTRLDEVCQEIGLSASRIRPILREHGYPTRAVPVPVVITKEDIEAELAKLTRGDHEPDGGSVPAPAEVRVPAQVSAPKVPKPEPKADPDAWPVKGKLAQLLAIKCESSKGRIALSDEIAKVTGLDVTKATQALTKLLSGTTVSLKTKSAQHIADALGIDPRVIWPDWTVAA